MRNNLKCERCGRGLNEFYKIGEPSKMVTCPHCGRETIYSTVREMVEVVKTYSPQTLLKNTPCINCNQREKYECKKERRSCLHVRACPVKEARA